jgi:hypothetical protein
MAKVHIPGFKLLAPIITSDGGGPTAAVSFAENGTDVVTTVVATQAHGGGPVNYSITAGADAALFEIVGATGELFFIDAPDFETPLDANADNAYLVTVTATGRGELTDTQAITVTVTNVVE